MMRILEYVTQGIIVRGESVPDFTHIVDGMELSGFTKDHNGILFVTRTFPSEFKTVSSKVFENIVSKITVTLEGGIPWARVEKLDGGIILENLSFVNTIFP